MTGTNDKLRALFLTALMVVSVFGATVAFSGAAAAAANDATLTDNGRYWLGQQVAWGGGTADTTYVIETTDGDFVSEVVADSTGTVVIETSIVGTGEFDLKSEDGTTTHVTGWEVREQSYDLSPETASTANSGTATTVSVDVLSNRASYTHVVSSPELSASQLAGVFSGHNPTKVDTNGDNTNDSVQVAGSSSQTLSPDFDGIAAGNYTLNFDVADTSASDSVSVEVSDVAAGGASFAETVVVQERGDIATITLSMTGEAKGGTATLELGSSEVSYNVNITATDSNGDGQIVIEWNTANSNDSTDAGLSVVGSDSQVGAVNVNTGSNDPVEAAEYPASVIFQGTETDVATVVIEDRSTTGLSTFTAPGNLGASDALAAATQSDTVAMDLQSGVDDWTIVRLQASGLGGYMNTASDFNASGTQGVSLSIVENEDTVKVNQDPLTANVSALAFVGDPANDTYYFAFRSNNHLPNAEVGDQFDVTFSVDADESAIATEDETVTTSYTYVAGSASIDLQGGKLFLPSSEDAMATGTSNFAPGTVLSLQLRSTGGQSPFVANNQSIVVSPAGTWVATFNLAEQSEGQTFDATLRKSGQTFDSAPGQIGELTAAVSFSDQTAGDAGTLVVVDSVALSDGGFVAIHQGGASGPVVGVSDYLSAGNHNDVRVRLQEPIDGRTTLVAMAHKDSDGDQTFDFIASNFEDDGPYTSGGNAVTSSATVSLETPTPSPEPDTPTATPEPGTPTATPEPGTPTPSPTPTTTPGFGLAVALLALIAAALLAIRRD